MSEFNPIPKTEFLPTPDPAPPPRIGQAPYCELVRGENFYLKRLLPEDISDTYLGWLNDTEVIRFLQVRFQTRDRPSVEAFVAGFDHINKFIFGVFAAENDNHIGNVTLSADPVHLFTNMGYLIGNKAYWGTGAGLETCRMISDFAFFERGLRKMIGSTTDNHVASNINFDRLGYSCEGKFPELYWSEGKYRAAVYWSMMARKWAEIRGRTLEEVTP